MFKLSHLWPRFDVTIKKIVPLNHVSNVVIVIQVTDMKVDMVAEGQTRCMHQTLCCTVIQRISRKLVVGVKLQVPLIRKKVVEFYTGIGNHNNNRHH